MPDLNLEQAREVLARQNVKLAELEGQVKLLTQQTLNVESLAGKRVPYFYVIPIQLDQAVSQLQEGTTQVSRSGPFFADRIICTLHIETIQSQGEASWVGRYLPLSSRWVYPYIFPQGNTGTIAELPPLDFEFGYESDASDRQRQDKYVPGDILERQDSDGILPVSDIFPEGATITFKVNPLRPVGNNDPWDDASTGVASFIFTAVFQGYKIIQPAQV